MISTEKALKFEGKRYTLGTDGYYSRSGKLMHRVVWEATHGPIPDGMHIHHIDRDRGNNELWNLECLDPAAHGERHRGTLADHYSDAAKWREMWNRNQRMNAWFEDAYELKLVPYTMGQIAGRVFDRFSEIRMPLANYGIFVMNAHSLSGPGGTTTIDEYIDSVIAKRRAIEEKLGND